jgi:hypothetical protein
MSELEKLKHFNLIYVGTPYTKYHGGIHAAFVDACRLTARLLRAGLRVYSPIAHTHPIAIHGEIDPLDLSVWLPFDAAIMGKSDAMIVGMLPGWDKSTGVQHEVDEFTSAFKPVFDMNPSDLSYKQRP